MDVEPLRLIAGETAGDALKRLADRVQMVQSFAQAEVGEVVGAELVAQKRRELFILLEEGVLEVGAEDMMAMLDLIDDGGELAAHPAVKAGSEDRGNLVGGESPQAQFAAALEQFVDGKVALEDEVAAIFDLGDGIEARQGNKSFGHTHHHGAKSFIADVEIVVGEAAALAGEDAVMRVLGAIFWAR